METCSSVGVSSVALQVAGSIITLVGLARTWYEWTPDDHWAHRLLRWVYVGPETGGAIVWVIDEGMQLTDSTSTTVHPGTARGNGDQSLPQAFRFIEELQTRVDTLTSLALGGLDEQEQRLAKARLEQARALEDAKRELASHADEQVRRAITGGLGLAALGVAVTLVGTLLSLASCAG